MKKTAKIFAIIIACVALINILFVPLFSFFGSGLFPEEDGISFITFISESEYLLRSDSMLGIFVMVIIALILTILMFIASLVGKRGFIIVSSAIGFGLMTIFLLIIVAEYGKEGFDPEYGFVSIGTWLALFTFIGNFIVGLAGKDAIAAAPAPTPNPTGYGYTPNNYAQPQYTSPVPGWQPVNQPAPAPAPAPAPKEVEKVYLCPACGAENNEKAAFCMVCGKKLGAPEPEPAEIKIFCPVCGKPINAEAAFCDGCGSKVNQPEPDPEPLKKIPVVDFEEPVAAEPEVVEPEVVEPEVVEPEVVYEEPAPVYEEPATVILEEPAPVYEEPAPAEPAILFCPNCGKQLNGGAFCGYCGTKVQ